MVDYAKIYRPIKDTSDPYALQNYLKNLENWSEKWLLKFNTSKCKVLHFGHHNPEVEYVLNGNLFEKSADEKDLGIQVSRNLKLSNHIGKIAAKANSILGIIRRTFTYSDIDNIPMLYTD